MPVSAPSVDVAAAQQELARIAITLDGFRAVAANSSTLPADVAALAADVFAGAARIGLWRASQVIAEIEATIAASGPAPSQG